MPILDDTGRQENLDSKNLYASVESLSAQCRHAWESCQKIELPGRYRSPGRILMTGMGGSGLGARIIESVYADELNLPLIRLNDYHLPRWADWQTLVFCSSFSGTTEETLANAREAIEKKCPWIAIAAGGELIELAKSSGAPFYQIDPKYNPSRQPRMSSGYLVVGQLALAAQLGLIKFNQKDIGQIEAALAAVVKANKRSVPTEKNEAKKLALKLKDRGVVFAAARHLVGAAHVIKNQMNENAKNFAALFDLPELNHHLMEGLAHPGKNANYLYCVLAASALYEKRIEERLAITEEVIKKNRIEVATLAVGGETEIAQAFWLIQFGSFVNFYLSMLYQIDPAPIPWVDYFKTKLGQPLGK